MRGRHDIPPLKLGRDDKGADAGPRADAPTPDDQFDSVNSRRLDLIDKRYREGTLSAAEEAELATLQVRVDELLQARHPYEREMLARLTEFERRLDEEGVPR